MIVTVVLLAAISIIATVLVACAMAWFVLSYWLEGRALKIASVACAIAAGLGRSSYAGPANVDALVAIISVAATIAVGLLVGKIWLKCWEKRING